MVQVAFAPNNACCNNVESTQLQQHQQLECNKHYTSQARSQVVWRGGGGDRLIGLRDLRGYRAVAYWSGYNSPDSTSGGGGGAVTVKKRSTPPIPPWLRASARGSLAMDQIREYEGPQIAFGPAQPKILTKIL